ncbi:MAG: vanadium-dependent haloperoxidase [Verrucomicrobiota bacterium]
MRRLGGERSSGRTADQTEIAHFWSDFSDTATPPGHWNQIAAGLAEQEKLTIDEESRMFTLLNLALADAGLAAFDCKYHFNFWRPETALRNDSRFDWKSLLPSPPHPEYVSGHSTFSGAAAEILKCFFGTDTITFETSSDGLPGVTRKFSSLWACAEEVGWSRIYGGIHYSFSNREGLALGKRVAAAVWKEWGGRKVAYRNGESPPRS